MIDQDQLQDYCFAGFEPIEIFSLNSSNTIMNLHFKWQKTYL